MPAYKLVSGSLWFSSKGLAQTDGLAWISKELAIYDWSRCSRLTIRRGGWGSQNIEPDGGVINPVCGWCRGSSYAPDTTYEILCKVNTTLGWPAYKAHRVRPLYREPNGSWPAVPDGHRVWGYYYNQNTGREWYKLMRLLPLNDESEAVVYIIAHEACHFLRLTNQIKRLNVNREIEADAFAMAKVEKFRKWRAT